MNYFVAVSCLLALAATSNASALYGPQLGYGLGGYGLGGYGLGGYGDGHGLGWGGYGSHGLGWGGYGGYGLAKGPIYPAISTTNVIKTVPIIKAAPVWGWGGYGLGKNWGVGGSLGWDGVSAYGYKTIGYPGLGWGKWH